MFKNFFSIILLFFFNFLLINSLNVKNNPYQDLYFHNQEPKVINKDTKLYSTFYFSDLLENAQTLSPVNNKRKKPTYVPKTKID